jgi:hypothetical protein
MLSISGIFGFCFVCPFCQCAFAVKTGKHPSFFFLSGFGFLVEMLRSGRASGAATLSSLRFPFKFFAAVPASRRCHTGPAAASAPAAAAAVDSDHCRNQRIFRCAAAEVHAFHRALLTATVQPAALRSPSLQQHASGSVITLPRLECSSQHDSKSDILSWPDMGSPHLFARHFYAPCWESVMAEGVSLTKKQGRKFVILGTCTCQRQCQ